MRVLDDDAEREFRAFVHASSASLTRTAHLLMSDAHLAKDLLQTALASTALHWSAAAERPDAYVRKTLYHQAISWWRWRRRRPESLLETVPEPIRFSDPSDDADRRVVVRAALAKLTPKQRAVLILRYFDDLPEREVAEILGCSVGTVKSQTRHALARLRVLAPELAGLLTPAEVES